MSKTTVLPQEQHVHKVKREEFGFTIFLYPEQKNTACMKDIAKKFKKPENLIADACAETFSVSRACILLSKQRRLIVCKIHSRCVTEVML